MHIESNPWKKNGKHTESQYETALRLMPPKKFLIAVAATLVCVAVAIVLRRNS